MAAAVAALGYSTEDISNSSRNSAAAFLYWYGILSTVVSDYLPFLEKPISDVGLARTNAAHHAGMMPLCHVSTWSENPEIENPDSATNNS